MDPQEIVNQAEAAYQSGDVDRILELFDPEIVIHWNGWKKAEGLAAARKMHEHSPHDRSYDKELEAVTGPEKTLRAASGDTIAVEFKLSRTFSDGSEWEGHGSEFWKMRGERLLEWNAYYREHDVDGEPVPHRWDGPHKY